MSYELYDPIEYQRPEDLQRLLDQNSEVVPYFYKMVRAKEEELLKRVLKDLLKREPTTDDAKKVALYYHSQEPDRYQMTYDGTVLGWIKREFNGPKFTVTFTPVEPFTGSGNRVR